MYQIWKPNHIKILIIAHEMHDGPLILPQIENATLLQQQGKCTEHSNSALNSHTWMEFFQLLTKEKTCQNNLHKLNRRSTMYDFHDSTDIFGQIL